MIGHDQPSALHATSDSLSWKRRARVCLDRFGHFVGLLALQERTMRPGLTVLMYHRVLPDEECRDYPLASLVMPLGALAEQVRWLAERCDVWPMREALDLLERGAANRRPLLALTFDDGYQDSHAHVAPVLEQHGLRGTFFVTTGFVQSGEPMWFDRAADLWTRASTTEREQMLSDLLRASPKSSSEEKGIRRWMELLKRAAPEARSAAVAAAHRAESGSMNVARFKPMTVQQAADLHARGHEVGSHTVTHPMLPQLDDEALAQELRESQAILERWIGGEVTGFCYPNGDFDARVEAAVRDAGYSYACTIQGGRNSTAQNRMRLARIDITRQRVLDRHGRHDELGFRSEVSLLRSWWRGFATSERTGCGAVSL